MQSCVQQCWARLKLSVFTKVLASTASLFLSISCEVGKHLNHRGHFLFPVYLRQCAVFIQCNKNICLLQLLRCKVNKSCSLKNAVILVLVPAAIKYQSQWSTLRGGQAAPPSPKFATQNFSNNFKCYNFIACVLIVLALFYNS